MSNQTDPVAVLRECLTNLRNDYLDRADEGIELAIAELERRQGREKRLEALVRRLTEEASYREPPAFDTYSVSQGLVEAARKEMKDG